jgi:hypothetical protein
MGSRVAGMGPQACDRHRFDGHGLHGFGL